jgi:hypothetical protein|tara:strand:+ start:15723 stop:16550 length:828 start_codon:yes stop_codon:yes gene_type:complete
MKLRLKHNKKRNTAFLYETLVRELTKAVMSKDSAKKKIIVKILKEGFRPGTVLAKQLEFYKAAYETRDVDLHTADKLLFEIRRGNQKIDKQKLFKEQSSLISKINKNLSKKVYSNFVPNYKVLATIYQLFNNPTLNTRQRVVLEENLVHKMLGKDAELPRDEVIIDGIVYRTFMERFNDEYKDLLEEQKQLLNNFVLSFADNGASLKLFLNEEIGRLKKVVGGSLNLEEVRGDKEMLRKTEEVLSKMENYKTVEIDDDLISEVLKIQALAAEIND